MTISEYVAEIKKVAFAPTGTEEENVAWLEWVLKVLTDERYARTWSPENALAECNVFITNPPPGKLDDLLEWRAELESLAGTDQQ